MTSNIIVNFKKATTKEEIFEILKEVSAICKDSFEAGEKVVAYVEYNEQNRDKLMKFLETQEKVIDTNKVVYFDHCKEQYVA